MQKLLQLELNEVNFDFVRAYGARGELPVLNGLMERHGVSRTSSEQEYSQLEPWIQWVSAHTGLAYADHGVFRLGDITERQDISQIWEMLEAAGLTVGAVSPMNARNACRNPAFFVPDPWTRTTVSGSSLMKRLYEAVSQLVNDNSTARVEPRSLAWLAMALARFGRPVNYSRYASLAANIRGKSWTRALILDLLLTDLFVKNVRQHQPDYSTLFLNAAAHIQHHYMFNSAVYEGPHRNPDWYISADTDPLLDVYRLYDALVGEILDAFPTHRILIATGLCQKPFPDLLLYWRLKDHAQFLTDLDIPFQRAEPRMSRDFVVYCADAAQALEAERLLKAVTADDGNPLFSVDNRGESLFAMFIYPRDIPASLGFALGNRHFEGLADKVAFVAVKNGEHDGTGYLIDTSRQAGSETGESPVADLCGIALEHFGVDRPKSLAA